MAASNVAIEISINDIVPRAANIAEHDCCRKKSEGG
jgi:hypothetical protein